MIFVRLDISSIWAVMISSLRAVCFEATSERRVLRQKLNFSDIGMPEIIQGKLVFGFKAILFADQSLNN